MIPNDERHEASHTDDWLDEAFTGFAAHIEDMMGNEDAHTRVTVLGNLLGFVAYIRCEHPMVELHDYMALIYRNQKMEQRLAAAMNGVPVDPTEFAMRAKDYPPIMAAIKRIGPWPETDGYLDARRDLLDAIDRFAKRAAMGSAPAGQEKGE